MIKKNSALVIAIFLMVRLFGQTPQLILDFPNPSAIYNFAELNGVTYFLAATDAIELWRTDGTQSGTFTIKDLNPPGLRPTGLVSNGKNLFFTGITLPNFAAGLFMSNGRAGNMTMVKIINPTATSEPTNLIAVGNKVFFRENDGTSSIGQLWVTDGTAAGTTKVMNDVYFSGAQIVYNGRLLFTQYGFDAGFNVNKVSLILTDGTVAGTTVLHENNIPFPVGGVAQFKQEQFKLFNGKVYFSSTGITNNVDQLWVTDGTAAGTTQVASINPNGPSNIGGFTEFKGKLYFEAQDATLRQQPWVTDGTAAGTVKLKNIYSEYPGFTIFDDKLFFSATDDPNGRQQVWVSDGTEQGTKQFVTPIPAIGPGGFISFNDKLYFAAKPALQPNFEWYVTDGTPANTKILNLGANVNIGGMVKLNEMLFISAENNVTNSIQMYAMDAGTLKWTGKASSTWYNPVNWLPQRIPVDTSSVIIPWDVPNNPNITYGTANCKNLTIEDGANLVMTGGTLNVYGKVSATNEFGFSLSGGTLNLFRGSKFPKDMTFNNLTITNINDNLEKNLYELPGKVHIRGNLRIQSNTNTLAGANLPKVSVMLEDTVTLEKNLIFNHGEFGYLLSEFVAQPPSDGTKLPVLHIAGSVTQNLSVNAKNRFGELVGSGNANGTSALAFNVRMNNPLASFSGSLLAAAMFNLDVVKSFDLKGRNLVVMGGLSYDDPTNANLRIRNSTSSRGSLNVGNAEYSLVKGPQVLRIDKLSKLEDYLSIDQERLLLLDNLTVDTIIVTGLLELNGKDLVIGNTTNGRGYLEVDSIDNTPFSQGTLRLLGNATTQRYKLAAKNLNNLVINSPSGVELQNKDVFDVADDAYYGMNLYGTAQLFKGSFDLKDNAIYLKSAGAMNVAKILESVNSTFTSTSTTSPSYITIDTTVAGPVTNQNYGNLGFVLTCTNPVNQLTIFRTPSQATGINGGTSINRQFVIKNPSTAGLNAFVSLRYSDNELLGVNESDLKIFRRDETEPTGVWHKVNSIVNKSLNIVTSTVGLPQLANGQASYTLASESTPLRLLPQTSEHLPNKAITLKVYPNPFTSSVTVQVKADLEEKGLLQVIDAAGKLMSFQPVQLVKGSNTFNINYMDKMPAGNYYIRIISKNLNRIQNLVKM